MLGKMGSHKALLFRREVKLLSTSFKSFIASYVNLHFLVNIKFLMANKFSTNWNRWKYPQFIRYKAA